MTELIFSIWKEIMRSPMKDEETFYVLLGALQVYASLMGMPDSDFQDIMHSLGESYPGPLPDSYSEDILNYYRETKNHD